MTSESELFYNLNLDAWPLVHVVLGSAPKDDEEFNMFQDAFLGVLQGVLADQVEHSHKDRISLVMELDGIVEASFAQKLQGVGFIRTIQPLVVPTIRCTALVIRSDTVRAIVEFILNLQPLKSLHAVFDNSADALAWCNAQDA